MKWALAELPEEFVVYQGGDENSTGKKWSWALEKDKAKFFAQKAFGNNPRIVTGKVKRDNVIAYFKNYDESELLIDPESVMDRRYTDDYAQNGPFANTSKST